MNTMILMRAKPLLDSRKDLLREKTKALVQTLGRAPRLAVILVGDDPASHIYVKNKTKAALSIGFVAEAFFFDSSTPPSKVFEFIQELNENPEIDGILIQRPLPSSFNEKDVSLWVSPEKDVDCLHPENIGLLVTGNPRFLPCTPAGILELLDFYQLKVDGKISCVIGRSNIVGKPLATLLMSRNSSIIQIHRSTKNPQELCKIADFVFAAAGSKHLLKKEWIKPGAIVVDIGIHRDEGGKLTGDVDQASLQNVVGGMTPVPGGVGPMTIQMLLENTFKAALNQGK
jgi:methylenetetrahydrofolate dehydrogenase (NADP+)/methenyltetrahydrofolate cyclohydrolase